MNNIDVHAGLQGESATVCVWAGMHSDSSGPPMIACAILSGSLGYEVGVRQCAGVHGASSGCTLHLVDSSRFVNAKVGWYAKALSGCMVVACVARRTVQMHWAPWRA